MTQRRPDSIIRRADRVAEVVGRLSKRGYRRESLIVRLVAGGFTIKDAADLRLEAVISVTDELKELDCVNEYGRCFDPFCRKYGCDNLGAEVVLFVREAGLVTLQEPNEGDLARPLFPSRKGGNGITCRTAERCLVAAQTGVGVTECISFREAGAVGRELRECLDVPNHNNCLEQLTSIVDRLRPMISRMFPGDVHEQQDAAQELALEMLTGYAVGFDSEGHAFSDAFRILRQRREQYVKYRINEVSGILGDWNSVTNSHDAKTRANSHDPKTRGNGIEQHDAAVMLDKIEIRKRIEEVLALLPYRERMILKLRWGLEDGFIYLPHEIAEIFKITPQRVRQLEVRAMRRLRKPRRCKKLVGCLVCIED